MGFAPDDLPIIRTARQMGFGCRDMSEIEVVGDGFAEFVCKDFEAAEPIPIQFTFGRVCKSVAKQVILLAKSLIRKS